MPRNWSLIHRPLWWKRTLRFLVGESRHRYWVGWTYGEISYEDDEGLAISIGADILTHGPYERELRRDLAVFVKGETTAPVDAETWAVVSKRIATYVAERRLKWKVE